MKDTPDTPDDVLRMSPEWGLATVLILTACAALLSNIHPKDINNEGTNGLIERALRKSEPQKWDHVREKDKNLAEFGQSTGW